MPTDRFAGTRRFRPHRVHMLALVAYLSLIAACGGGRPTPTPFVPSPPAATAKAWAMTADDMTYSTTAHVGGSLIVTAVLRNTGAGDNPAISVIVNDLADYADLVGCTPTCDEGLLGILYLPGVPAGSSRTYKIEFIPTKVGAAHWSVCIYDDRGGAEVFCGDGTTVIR